MENRDTVGAGKPSPLSPSKRRAKRSSGAPTWVANVIMLLLGVIIGAVGHWLIAPVATSSGSMFDQLVARTRYLKGNSNAPVTIIEFSDFQ